MRTIVLGAAGFIGRHLSRRLAAAGEEVVGLDVVPADGETFEHHVVDGTRDDFDYEGADAVVYLSQSPHYREFAERGDDLFAVNVVGALRAATAAHRAGAKAFLYASTGNVYAPSFEPLAEASPVHRDDPYALSKITAENALELLDTEMQTTSFRLFGAFGPGQKTMLVPAIIGRVQRGDPVTLERNPSNPDDDGGLRISLTYVDDVVDNILALRDRAVRGEDNPAALNIAAPEAVSLRQLATTIGERLGVEPKFDVLDSPRKSDFVADVSALQKLIGPEFTSFADAIERTVAPQ